MKIAGSIDHDQIAQLVSMDLGYLKAMVVKEGSSISLID